jgi:hypothetical protein
MGANLAGDKGNARRSYTKPVVKRVHLKPEEAVLGGCKVTSQFGPTAVNCKPVGNCSGISS